MFARVAFVSLALSLAATSVGCEESVEDPTAPLMNPSWPEKAGEVDGFTIGESQVQREMRDHDVTREEAVARLEARKRMLAKALEQPPEHAELKWRQAMVETMLLEEGDKSEAGGEIDQKQVEKVREELTNELRKPAGYVATIVRVRAKPDAEVAAFDLLGTAEGLIAELGDDPSDDEVASLADREFDDRVVTVNYAVPFPAADETKSRAGWANVSSTGAGEVQTLEEGDRVTTAYTVGESVAEFMVRITKIPAEAADEAKVDTMIDERLQANRRENYAKRLVDRLVEEGSWTIFPDTMEGDLEVSE